MPKAADTRLRIAVISLAVACTEPAVIGEQASLVKVRDSMGITIVDNDERAADTGSWRIDPDPILVIGNDESRGEDYLFGGVAGAARLRNGEIVVSDGSGRAVSLYDAHGTFLRRIGRTGSGPGEYRSPGRVFLRGEDTIVVRSAYTHQPAHFFNTSGRLIRSWIGAEGAGRADGPLGLFADGTVLGRVDIPRNIRELVPEPLVPTRIERVSRLVRTDPNGQIVTDYGEYVTSRATHVFTYEPFPLVPSRMVRQGYQDSGERYLPRLQVAVRGNELLVSNAATFEIRILAADGQLVSIVRKNHPAVPLPREFVDSTWALILNVMPAADARRVAPVPVPSHAPALDRLMVDGEGNVWVRSYPPGGPPKWLVFDPQGVLRHTLHSELDPVQIGPDFVLAVVRDSVGVSSVAVYSLTKQAADLHR